MPKKESKNFTVLGDRADAVRLAWRKGKRKVVVEGHTLMLENTTHNQILVKDADGVGVGRVDKKAAQPTEILKRIWPDEDES